MSQESHIRVVARIRPLNAREVSRGISVSKLRVDGIIDENENASASAVHQTPRTKGTNASVLDETPLVRNSRRLSLLSPPSQAEKMIARPLTSPTAVSFNRIIAEGSSPRSFSMDAVLTSSSNQEQVYECLFQGRLATNLMEGYNTTVLAYGQTGAGKSFTMMGQQNDEHKQGVIPRAMKEVFKARQHAEIKVEISFMEIYKDELRDLLGNGVLRLQGDSKGNVVVLGATRICVDSVEELQEYYDMALTARTTGSTKLNDHSSRSHAICTLFVTTKLMKEGEGETTHAKLTLVDLAGSERIKTTCVQGIQQEESININKDLLVLGQVVAALEKKQAHVPYRDSKLTRLLSNSLGGNCRTILLACVSPTDIDESMNTLRYAERARAISSTIEPIVVSNNEVSIQKFEETKAENRRLKAQIFMLQKKETSCHKVETLMVDTDTESVGGQSIGEQTVDTEFAGLIQKMRKAKIAARRARERSRVLKSKAKSLQEKCSQRKLASHDDDDDLSIVSCLTYETALNDEDIDGQRSPATQPQQVINLVGTKDDNPPLSPNQGDIDRRTKKSRLPSWIPGATRLQQESSGDMLEKMGKLLAEKTIELREAETKIKVLNQENASLRQFNDTLVQKLKACQTPKLPPKPETPRLLSQSPLANGNRDDTADTLNCRPATPEVVGSHAARLVKEAKQATEYPSDGSPGGQLSIDTVGTSLNFSPEKQERLQPIVISNMEDVQAKCDCQQSIFGGKEEQTSFYLPKLHIECACGKHKFPSSPSGKHSSSLSHILRDWQREFLSTQGINTAEELLDAHRRIPKTLASEMRKWRRKKKMKSVKTKSCAVAVHVWTRTCKAVLKSVGEQKAMGIVHPMRPNLLDVSIMSDGRTVSTLGVYE